MIITGTLIQSGETASPSSSTPTFLASPLQEGNILVGRITQSSANGQGLVRFPNGAVFSFAGGQTLQVGEQVTLEVTRLQPEVMLRLVASETGSATNLAHSLEQSLMRAPDLLDKLMDLSGLTTHDQSKTGNPLFPLKGGRLMAGKETLAGVLQKALPNLTGEGLLKGELTALVRLLETGSRQEVIAAVRGLRQAEAQLRFDGPPALESGEVSAARTALQRVGDLLTMQHVLPQVAVPEDGSHLLGYRLFWLTEGGLGEAIWRRERDKQRPRGNSGDESMLSVLLSLNMTQLGMVQARLVYGEGMLQVNIAARNEASLVRLRGEIGQLRQNLLAAQLPLRTLDLIKLGEGEMQAQRLSALGLGTGFATEV